MNFPEFFESAPRITVRDPLARFLGAAEDGIIEYTYSDAVKLAGHSCPTVASAYLMTRAAMRALYPAAFPERGGIRVELRDDRITGVAGVVANVVSLLNYRASLFLVEHFQGLSTVGTYSVAVTVAELLWLLS